MREEGEGGFFHNRKQCQQKRKHSSSQKSNPDENVTSIYKDLKNMTGLCLKARPDWSKTSKDIELRHLESLWLIYRRIN